jgi:hypothetical protein
MVVYYTLLVCTLPAIPHHTPQQLFISIFQTTLYNRPLTVILCSGYVIICNGKMVLTFL